MKYHVLNNGPIAREIVDKVGNEILAAILWNRDCRTLEQLESIFNPESYSHTPPHELPGILNAVEMIVDRINKKQRIAVYGDYDVDGVTSTTLLTRTLRTASTDVIYHVPDRFNEGYGMSADVVRKLNSERINLIITCDCGINNHEEIELARQLGMEVIVTDHHLPPDTPVPANVIINPKLLPEEHPCYHIPGVGVSYLLAQALQQALGIKLDFEPLQLVALGIVADVVPLRAENRYWLRKGLKILNSSDILPGIKALINVARTEYVDEDVIGFQLAPMLNAPGRIASADLCVRLLLTDDPNEADSLALEINALNEERKNKVDRVLEEFEEIRPQGCIVEYNPFWHEGVIGIAAGRLCDKYQLPVVLMTLKEDGKTVTGSARSIDGVNIYERLARVENYLTQFGGHTKAAGLSCELDQLDQLIPALRKELAIVDALDKQPISVDLVLPLDEVTPALYDAISQLGPFGESFAKPVFCSLGVNIADCQQVSNGKHTRLRLKNSEGILSAVWWNNNALPSLKEGTIIYTLGVNRYKGATTLQLEIMDLEAKPALIKKDLLIQDMRCLPGTTPPVLQGEGIGVFVEGRWPSNDYEFNRYQVKPCETLVLTSIPPNINLLKHIVKKSNCSRLVLAYPTSSKPPLPLLNRIMAVVKGMAAKNHQLSVRDIAIACEETEAGIRNGLMLLTASNMLTIHWSGEFFQVKLLPGNKVNKDSRYYKQLKAAEAENNAFRSWMQTVSPDELRHYIFDMVNR